MANKQSGVKSKGKVLPNPGAAPGFSYSKFSAVKKRDYWDKIELLQKEEYSAATDLLKENSRVLEFGAGDLKPILKRIKERNLKVDYFSCDIDRDTPQDYYDLFEIDQTFDTIVACRVFEHIEFNDLIRVAKKCFEISDKVIFTVPNIFAPSWTYRKDFTHISVLSPDGWRYVWLQEGGFSKFRVSRIASTRNIFLKGLVSRLTSHDLLSMSLLIEVEK